MPYLFSTFILHLLHQTPHPSYVCSVPALGRWACIDHHLGSAGGFQQCKPVYKTQRLRRGHGSSPSSPCLTVSKPQFLGAFLPNASSQLSVLVISGVLTASPPLLFPGCTPPHPCLFPNLYNLFFCTNQDEISFLLGACLMKLTIPKLVNSKQYII